MHPCHRPLRRIRILLRGSRLLHAWVAVTALAAALWLGFGLVDAFAAFEPSARMGITVALLILLGLAIITSLIRALRVPWREAARVADDATGDPRRPASAALTIHDQADATPLAKHLAERAMGEASSMIASLPARRMIPWKPLAVLTCVMVLPLTVAGVLRISAPEAFDTVARRLLHPAADIPPYSPLRFALDPEKPSTVYGGDVLVAAEISGGQLHHPVLCMIRQPRTGEVLKLPAFRESATRFSRKLDALTEPVEVAFACGKARSAWHDLDILLEPEILGGLVRVRPPEYTGLPPAEYPLDTNEIAALEGSEITLELTSNRPLAAGTLAFTPAAVPGAETKPESHVGSVVSAHSVSFTITATRTGRLAATVRDLRGTPNPRPLELTFRCLPDQAPSVLLESPPQMMLATPKSRIPVLGRAEDDFALSKVHVVRTLTGFRDRSHGVAPALRDKQYDFKDQLDLEELGLKPGQTIEIMLDASDHNPSLLGQGSSGISRIQIISEDQYAEYIRARTTLREFANRFEAARDALDAARESLEKLKEAVEKGDKEAIEKAAADARKEHEKAADLLEKIAEDFPAFDLEKRLKELAEKQVDDLRQNLAPLENHDAEAPKEEQLQAIEEMLGRLRNRQPEAEQLQQDADFVNKAAQLLEMAAKFRQIYENQASLAKRFGTIVEELRLGQDQNRRLLPMLGETQEKNRTALDEFKVELRRRAEALPKNPAHELLADSALRFLRELEVAEPETLMDAAAKHGKAGAAMDAFTNAERARALLERLLSQPEPFAQAARGQAPNFEVPRPDVNRNLQQMLDALLGQMDGQGKGDRAGGQGIGPGGVGMDGMRGDGFPMDLPVAGPDRMRFGDGPSASAAGKGGGKGAAATPLPDTAEHGTLKPTDSRQGKSSSANPESIPEPYREAVKRFLTP
jgi:hypothetical protein